MSQTETYANLLSTIEALHGATFIDVEKTRIRHLVNSRARSAYRESDLWDQFLVTGEERVVNDSDPTNLYVPFVGTTSADTNCTSIQAGDIDTVLRAHNANPFAVTSPREYEVLMAKDGVILPGYKATYGASQAITEWGYLFGSAIITLPGKTDAINGGTVKVENVVTSQAAANDIVNDTFTLTAVGAQVDTPVDSVSVAIAHAFTVVASESDISTATVSFPVVYLTYKRRLTETYGDQDGDTTTIPMEWRDYISLGVFADTLASDGFVEKSFALEARANKALQLELERLDRNRGNQFVNHRVRTHGSAQARQSSQL